MEAGEGEVKPNEKTAMERATCWMKECQEPIQEPKPCGRREVVMVRYLGTGQRTIQIRFSADKMSESERLEARIVYSTAGGMDEGTPGTDPAGKEQAELGPEPDQEGQRQ